MAGKKGSKSDGANGAKGDAVAKRTESELVAKQTITKIDPKSVGVSSKRGSKK